MRPYDVSELEAYVDGELDAVRRAELAAWLARHPEAQAVAETLRYQNAGLHAIFGKLLHQPVPPRLRAALHREPSESAKRLGHLPLIWVVAGGLLLVASALIGWLAHGYSFGRSMHEDQLAAFVESMQEATTFCDVAEESGGDNGFLISQEEEHPLLQAEGASGLRLLEARMLSGKKGLSTVLLFSDEQGRHISLFIQSRDLEEEQAPQLIEEDGINYFLWSDGPLSCTLVSPASV